MKSNFVDSNEYAQQISEQFVISSYDVIFLKAIIKLGK